jgi:hypothetical protein
MGWNSWDCYGTTITEAQFKDNVEVMAAKLKPFGWQYAVVDIQWYEPNAKGFNYDPKAILTMDGYGRLLPAVNRFPSADKGAGFKALSDYTHKKGLKFGIHLMRGIPRQAVEKNLPILGTEYKAADIADLEHVCPWNSDMYGVDMTKPGAQEYYNSVFALIASWGVDFVKVDDLSRPYLQNRPEVEAIRRAIDKTKRPMILSLSPGETDLAAATHVFAYANMWRISDDFWDSWPALKSQFKRLENWNGYRGVGYYPDADMLPLGTLANGSRKTNFTKDEQYTLMTLWAIAKSPLMLGADMTKLDPFTESLLTNKEVLNVNQHSVKNQQGLVAWSAEDPKTKDRFVAIFNIQDRYDITRAEMMSEGEIINRETPNQGNRIIANLEGFNAIGLYISDAGDGLQWDHGLWLNPTVELEHGTTIDLGNTPWEFASVGYGKPSQKDEPGGKPITYQGQPVKSAISAHAPSLVVFKLPAGAISFSGFAALDDSCMKQTGGATVQHFVYGFKDGEGITDKGRKFNFDFGLDNARGGETITDLWTGESWKLDSQTEHIEVPWHGCRLYRISKRK